jgi:hypothetical protein
MESIADAEILLPTTERDLAVDCGGTRILSTPAALAFGSPARTGMTFCSKRIP